MDLIQELCRLGVFMTSSIKKSYNEKLWRIMQYKTKGFSSGRTLYNQQKGVMYNLIMHSKIWKIFSSSFTIKKKSGPIESN